MTALRRWGLWVAVVAVAVAALAVGSARHTSPSLDQRTQALAEQVRCPVCGGESAAQSQVPAAQAIRRQIHDELAAGVRPARVLDDVTAAYGTGVLERPPAHGLGLLVWLVPLLAALAGVAGLGAAFARWRRPARPLPADDADDALVAAALRRAGPGPGHDPAAHAGPAAPVALVDPAGPAAVPGPAAAPPAGSA